MTQKWTQEEAVNFECARETISHLMAIRTADIAEEQAKKSPDLQRIDALRLERSALADEREMLSVSHHEDIARILKDYGQQVRDDRLRECPRAV